MLSDGGVHSHQNHLFYLAKILKKAGININIHIFLDGRDTAPKSAEKYITNLLEEGLEITTATGRYYAMDRDTRWERTEIAYNAIANGIGEKTNNCVDFLDIIKNNYKKNITDEFIKPIIRDSYKGVEDGDGFFNDKF